MLNFLKLSEKLATSVEMSMRSVLRDLLGWFCAARKHRSVATSPTSRSRLHFDHLEDRVVPSFSGFTDHEQLMIELINYARTNPSQVATEFGLSSLNQGLDEGITITNAPKQPLAPNQALLNTANAYSEEMYARNIFSHPSGAELRQNFYDQGYFFSLAGENLAFGVYDQGDEVEFVRDRHQALFLSKYHRPITLNRNYDEIGVGIAFVLSPYHSANPVNRVFDGTPVGIVTQHYATRDSGSATDAFFTGVAYIDEDGDQFYSVGEGLGGVTIRAISTVHGTYTTRTASTGGYSLQVPAGTYTITASGGELDRSITLPNVPIGNTNVKIDFVPLPSVATPPVISGISEDWGVANDGITADNTIQIQGTGVSQSTINVYLNGNSIGTTDVDATGQWTFDHTGTALNDGTYSLRATTTYEGETSNFSQSFSLTIRSTALSAPQITRISNNIPALGSGVTTDQTLTLYGEADPTTTVFVSRDGVVVGQVTPNNSGLWSFDYNTTLPVGNYQFQVQSVDQAAGRSAWSSLFDVTIITNSPPVFSGIEDRTIKHDGETEITLVATDPDGDVPTYSAEIQGYSKALQWNNEKQFSQGPDYRNYYGYDEKWIFSTAESAWYIILPSGDLHFPVSRNNIGQPLETFGVEAWEDLSKLYDAQEPETPDVSTTVVGNKLKITPREDRLLTFQVTVTATDQIEEVDQTFLVTTRNTAPTLPETVNDRQVSHTADVVTFELPPTDADGDTLIYSAQFLEYDEPYLLDQRLGFRLSGSYYTNYLGQGEKWIYSDVHGTWYLLYPDGKLHQTVGNTKGDLVADLESNVYTDPRKLHDPVEPTTLNIPHSFDDSQLSIDLTGLSRDAQFLTRVTASDDLVSVSKLFSVELTNLTPDWNEEVSDQTVSHNESMPRFDLSATDPDGDDVTYSVEVAEILYAVDQELGLYKSSSYYENYIGAGEKWIRSQTEQTWYLLLPSGLYRTDGRTVGELVEELDPAVFDNPSLLHNATTGLRQEDVVSSFTHGILELSVPDGFLGTLRVRVTATDNTDNVQRNFDVEVTNEAPEFVSQQAIPTQNVPHAQPSFDVDVSATDADGDTILYNVEFRRINRLHELDQEKDFIRWGISYYDNASGLGEKWIYSNAEGRWYYILEDGNLKADADPSRGWEEFSEQIGEAAWNDPDLIHEAEPGEILSLPHSVQEGRLFITLPEHSGTPPKNPVESFQVEVTATDTLEYSPNKTFRVNILNYAPRFTTSLPDLQLSVDQFPYSIPLNASDLDNDPLEYSIEVKDLWYDLDNEKDFILRDQYYESGGIKWIYSRNESWWYAIYSDGRLIPYRGTNAIDVGADVWDDPTRLHEAANSGKAFLESEVQANAILFQSTTAADRLFAVTIRVTDGIATTSHTFEVRVS